MPTKVNNNKWRLLERSIESKPSSFKIKNGKQKLQLKNTKIKQIFPGGKSNGRERHARKRQGRKMKARGRKNRLGMGQVSKSLRRKFKNDKQVSITQRREKMRENWKKWDGSFSKIRQCKQSTFSPYFQGRKMLTFQNLETRINDLVTFPFCWLLPPSCGLFRIQLFVWVCVGMWTNVCMNMHDCKYTCGYKHVSVYLVIYMYYIYLLYIIIIHKHTYISIAKICVL